MGKGYEGMLASLALHQVRGPEREYKNAEASATIYAGRAVVAGTNPGDVVLPSATGQTFLGIAFLNPQWGISEPDMLDGTNGPGFKPTQPVSVFTFGDIWVYSEVAVNPGDPVYFRHTAGTAPNTVIGRFRKNADTDKADQIVGATYIDKSSGAGLVRINLGGH